MVHAGCFLERQYCTFTGTVRGHNSREFIGRLVARGFVRVIEPGPVRRGRLYHVHHKPLYEAIGQADNRNRRLHTLGRMVERVMILDALLDDRRCWWLSPADDKLQFFSQMRDNRMQREDYPHIAFGAGRQRTIRCFPDKLPIGIEKDSMEHLVFLYLVNRRIPVDFRQFLLRHVGLLRMVHRWTLRLLVPRRFRKAVALYKAAIREELWTPMNPSVSRSLETYFADCHARGAHVGDPDDPYLRREFTQAGQREDPGALSSLARARGSGALGRTVDGPRRRSDTRLRARGGGHAGPPVLAAHPGHGPRCLGQEGGQAKIASGWPPGSGGPPQPSPSLGQPCR